MTQQQPAEGVDIFAPRYADTTFRMENVFANAERLGAMFQIKGPYLLAFSKRTIDTWTFTMDGVPHTIDVRQYKAIMSAEIKPHELAEQMLIHRSVALRLYQLVRQIERTASIRATAMQMEFDRVAHAAALAPRRREIIEAGGGPAAASAQ